MDRIEEEEDSKEGNASMGGDEEVNSTDSVEKKGPPIASPAKKRLSPNIPNPAILENYIPAHWKDKAETDCAQAGSTVKVGIKLGSVWDLAGMPESYFGDSDPEAETPVRNNSVKDFDVTTGSHGALPFMDDYSLDDESADLQLLFDVDNHNITDPTEDSEYLRKNVMAAPKHDVPAQDGDEIRHSLALTITDEEDDAEEDEDEDDGTISPSSTSEGTNGGEGMRLSWSVSEEEDESSSSYKDAKQTFTDSFDTSNQPHEVAVVNMEHSVTKKDMVPLFSPDISWPRAHAKGEWTQIDDSTTVKVAHAHAKGEWAQTKGSSAIQVEYLQFFTPEVGKATNEMSKIIKGAPSKSAPIASMKTLDRLNLQPTSASSSSMPRLAAPAIPPHDESVTDESKSEARSNASTVTSDELEFFSPQPSKPPRMPRVQAPPILAHYESSSDESKVVKEVPRTSSTPNYTSSKALDFLVSPQLPKAASSVSPDKVSPLPNPDQNVSDSSSIASSTALDFPSPQPSTSAFSVSPKKPSVLPRATQDEGLSSSITRIASSKTALDISSPQSLEKMSMSTLEVSPMSLPDEDARDESNIVHEGGHDDDDRGSNRSSNSTPVALSQGGLETDATLVISGAPTTPSQKKKKPYLSALEWSPMSLHDPPDMSVLQSWAQTVMTKLKTDKKNQKLLLSM